MSELSQVDLEMSELSQNQAVWEMSELSQAALEILVLPEFVLAHAQVFLGLHWPGERTLV